MASESDGEWGGPFVAELLRATPAERASPAVLPEAEGPFALVEGETPTAIRIDVSIAVSRRSSGRFWQPDNDFEITCGEKVDSITASAVATYASGRTEPVTERIQWMWQSIGRGAGASPVGIETLMDALGRTTDAIGVLARVDVGPANAKVLVKLRRACSVADFGPLTPDEKLLTRLVFAESSDQSDTERAAIAWTIRNRVAKIAAGDPEARRSFGLQPTIKSVIEHKAGTARQYDSCWKALAGEKNAVDVWNAIDAPKSLPCVRCRDLRAAVTVTRGVLRGDIPDPYAAEGGAYFFHLKHDGVIVEDRKGAIVRLPRKDLHHHFWTYAPEASRELEAWEPEAEQVEVEVEAESEAWETEAELYDGPSPSTLAGSWRGEPELEQLTTDPIAGPVGRGQANAREDVLKVQGRLRELGMTWVTESGVIGNGADDPTDRAIRLFRGILDAAGTLDTSRAGGVIAPGSREANWLRSAGAPRWFAQVPTTRDGWCTNDSAAASCAPAGGAHGMTSWLAVYLSQVGGVFRGRVAALRAVLDVYVSGHRAALDRLANATVPKVGPPSDVELGVLRTKEIAQRVIDDLVGPATAAGLDPEALARATSDAIANGAALLSIGNIARPQGGPYPPHSQHQNGLQFDLRLFAHRGPQPGLTWSSSGCSRLLMGVAIDCFLANSDTLTVIYNDTELRRRLGARLSHDSAKVVPPVHDNHVHVAIRGANGRLLQPAPPVPPPAMPPRRGPSQEVGEGETAEGETEEEGSFERIEPAPPRGTVYLTFDDGLQLGTQQVFDALRRNDARGTFFLTGAHIRYYEKNVGAGLLKAIAADARFDLANHSQSHANQGTRAFYAGGIVLRNGTKRSVVDDFGLCDKTVAEVLGRPSARLAFGRLPGRNTWRVVNLPGVTDGTNQHDSADEADSLSQAGYQIVGWDHEWFMEFSGTSAASDYDPDVDPSDRTRDAGTYWTDAARDRTVLKGILLDGKTVAGQVLAQLAAGAPLRKKGKLVLLMHDRAFRPDSGADPARFTRELEVLIQQLKTAGIVLEKISSY